MLKELCPIGKDLSEEKEKEYIERVNILNSNIRELTHLFKIYLLNNVDSFMSLEELKVPEYDVLFDRPKINGASIINDIKREYSHELAQLLLDGKTKKFGVGTNEIFADSLILNFNYTNTADLYNQQNGRNYTEIKIHGSISDAENEILLGFGDEKDSFYQTLESYNRNEYLEFMKSSHYAKNENYKRLFDFIESDAFQVQIVGHSCGLSDRTLLNSIFQHKYCMSIKIFYYKYNCIDKFNETDNFSQIFRNISRHFSDKKNMRDRIVNKSYCRELPKSAFKHGN